MINSSLLECVAIRKLKANSALIWFGAGRWVRPGTGVRDSAGSSGAFRNLSKLVLDVRHTLLTNVHLLPTVPNVDRTEGFTTSKLL